MGKSYRDLVVWQEAMNLVTKCYAVSSQFPSSERFGLTSQLQRASVSVAANIAEGRGRKSAGEFRYHISISRGSLAEVETYLELARRLKMAWNQDIESAEMVSSRTGRMLTALHTTLSGQIKAKGQKPKAKGDRRDNLDA